MPEPTLTFAALRAASVSRCETAFHGLDRWNPAEWGNALAGECGEACNVLKKLRRRETNPDWAPEDGDPALLADLADELADVVIYADLTAARMGIDLAAAVVAKFNRTSEKVGASQRLQLVM